MRPITTSHYSVRIPAHFATLAEPIMAKAGIRNFPDFVRQAVMNQIRMHGHMPDAPQAAPQPKPFPFKPKELKIARGVSLKHTLITAVEERARARGENFSRYVVGLIERDLGPETPTQQQEAGK